MLFGVAVRNCTMQRCCEQGIGRAPNERRWICMSFISAKQVIDQAVSLCIECSACTRRCAVLEEKDAAGNPLAVRESGVIRSAAAGGAETVGTAPVAGGAEVATAASRLAAAEGSGNDGISNPEGNVEVTRNFAGSTHGITVGSLAAVFSAACSEQEMAAIAGEHPAAVFAVRRCFMCGYCTLNCPTHVDARSMFTAARELFSLSGVVDGSGFSMTQVDKEWDCFTAYRAVYGIWYVDLPQIEDASALHAETLFFPGCPLASYSPDLTRQAFVWLQENEGPAVFTDACCGSPLKTAGYGDRAESYKKHLIERIISAKIKRIVCVCPGCAEELQSALDAVIGVEDSAHLPGKTLDLHGAIAKDACGLKGSHLSEGVSAVQSISGVTSSGALPEIVALPQLLADAGVRIDAVRARELACEGAASEDAASGAATFTAPEEHCASDVSSNSGSLISATCENASSIAKKAVCIAPFDSCHDRSGMFGRPLRALLQTPGVETVELAHHGANTLCCGGAGAVSLVDPDIKNQRIDYLLGGEAAQVGADLLVSNCPTCTYTAAQKRRADAQAGLSTSHAVSCNYLELVFPGRFDWDTVFAQLEGMWSGQYAAWVRSVLL